MSELHCDEFVELLTDYLDGALDAETARRVLEHLPVCPGCEDYFDQFRQTISLLAASGSTEPSG